MILKLASAVAVLALVLAACGGGSDDDGAANTPTRTIRITASDDLRFDPASLSVAKGEIVLFLVTNAGSVDHEFFLADAEAQQEHEAMVSQGHSMQMSDALAALELPPGETKQATVTFREAGALEYACHIDGHYIGGMKGDLTVT